MQLFISQHSEINSKTITVNDPRICYQAHRVLRYEVGRRCYIQTHSEETTQRFDIEITKITKHTLEGDIINQQKKSFSGVKYGMILGLLNKKDKIELQVQKLTEIGIDEIILIPMQRSVIKEISEHEKQRLEGIMIEAVEQSFGWFIPKLIILRENECTMIKEKNIVEFSLGDESSGGNNTNENLYGVVGPEGGITDHDRTFFPEKFQKRSLGENNLRAETASIIGGRLIKKTMNKS